MKHIISGLFLIIFAAILAACGNGESLISTKEYVLTTSLENGTPVFMGVGDEINGVINPKLYAEAGQTITVTLINGGEGQHQIIFPTLKVQTEKVSKKGESSSITFSIPMDVGELEYEDGNTAFAALGMKGMLIVGEAQAAPVSQPQTLSCIHRKWQLPPSKKEAVLPVTLFRKYREQWVRLVPTLVKLARL